MHYKFAVFMSSVSSIIVDVNVICFHSSERDYHVSKSSIGNSRLNFFATNDKITCAQKPVPPKI